MTRLKCANTGEWIDLNKEISKSGEGRIYKTSKSGFLAKIYHNITPDQIDKIQMMVKNPPADPTRSQGHVSIAWPEYLLQDNYGKGLGFLMPAVRNGQTLINVYSPKRREKNAPGFNWFYLYTTASNLASIVQEVHAKNYVIGDLKPHNLLVTPNAYVSIIDTDSFQILDSRTRKIYRCPVVSGEYTPPEMFSKDPQKVDRSEHQDRFGLAVIIWHLLFGYHPFSGEWIGSGNQPDTDQYIERGYWMYGSNSQLRPNQFAMPINIIHPELQKLFRKCFNDGHNQPYARPSAADWRTALDVAIKELNQCSVEGGHYYATSSHKCYWCERKRQLNGYDMFATPPGMRQPNVSTRPQAPVPIRQAVSPFAAPQAPVPIRQAVSLFAAPPVITTRPVKFAKILSKLKALIGYGAIVLIVLLLGAIALPSFLTQAHKAKQPQSNLASNQNLQAKLTPQQVVTKYYQIAPLNREGAKALLSDAYKNWYKQNKVDSAATNFWNTINKAEIYNLANVSLSPNNYKIKVWLKYSIKDGTQLCESQEVEVILDKTKAQWLIDKTNNIEQKPDCGR